LNVFNNSMPPSQSTVNSYFERVQNYSSPRLSQRYLRLCVEDICSFIRERL